MRQSFVCLNCPSDGLWITWRIDRSKHGGKRSQWKALCESESSAQDKATSGRLTGVRDAGFGIGTLQNP